MAIFKSLFTKTAPPPLFSSPPPPPPFVYTPIPATFSTHIVYPFFQRKRNLEKRRQPPLFPVKGNNTKKRGRTLTQLTQERLVAALYCCHWQNHT